MPETRQRPAANGRSDYVVPLVHARIPGRVVDVGFWGALAATAAAGVVDPPLAALVGAGVIVARRRARA